MVKINLRRRDSGFTLIELLITIGIVGILAAVALPYYRGYIIRAKITEVEHTMSVVESALTAYRMDQSFWPNCANVTDIRNTLGVSLAQVQRISEISITNGEINAILDNIDPIMVDGKTLKLIPTTNNDGSISWAWGWSPDFPVHLRPKH